MIELRDVKKRLGKRQILDGMTLAVPAGMNYVLMGASGSGKSVTLRHVIGILRPDAGSVAVDG
jgi:phospholipid/cholesterol/gamma-HCH transport system ATP-binding protein